MKITGVRWEESPRRKNSHGEVTIMSKANIEIAEAEYEGIAYKITKQGGIALPLDNRENAQMVEQCYRTRSTSVNPIIDWTDGEVWEFIHEYKVPYCKLYDQGYKRLGCIGCPMSTHQQEELERYPKFKKLYLMAFEKMLNERKEAGLKTVWEKPDQVMDWWIKNQQKLPETIISELIDE